MPTLHVPNVSVKVDVTGIVRVKLDVKGGAGAVNFDVKARLEEKERRSQMVVIGFSLQLTTKPGIVKLRLRAQPPSLARIGDKQDAGGGP